MSDFLTNIAARAIAEPTLRPRTRSRFEPAGAGEEEGAAEWPVEPRTVQRSVVAAVAVPVAEGRAAEAAAGWKPAGRPAGSQPHDAPPARVAREVERNVERVIETRERVVRVPEVERVVERERVAAEEVRPHRFEEQAPRVVTKERGGRETEVRRERLVRTTVDRTNGNRASNPVRQASDVPSSEPVVHVSIGRVEVRAVASPQPQQRAAPRNARMTIDDYVARRKTKERR